MIDFTLAELLTGLDLSDNVGGMTDKSTISLHSAGRLVLNGEPLETDASFRERVGVVAQTNDWQTANAYELDAIGMRHGLIRDGYYYEAAEVSAESRSEKPER